LGLQLLSVKSAQTLVVGQLAGLRHPDGWFATADVAELFEHLRIDAPGNPAQELARLAAKGQLVRRKDKPPWSLTPLGQQRAIELMGEISAAPQLGSPGSELGGVRHQFIPPPLAPQAWAAALAAVNRKSPFEGNIFLMTRYPTRPDDLLVAVIERATAVCEAHGFHLLRADGRHADPLLPNNVFAHMWASQYGLALLEAVGDPPAKPAALNENLIFEVGAMLMTGRRCAILKDESVTRVPTDLASHIHHAVAFADVDAAEAKLHEALVKDFDSTRCARCPTF
jgi:hypothetical protein